MAQRIKFHQQATGKNAGKLVPCPANKKCRLGEAAHSYFDLDQARFMRDVMGVNIQIPRELITEAATFDTGVKTPVMSPARTKGIRDALSTPNTLNDEVRFAVEQALADREYEAEHGISKEQFLQLSIGDSQFGQTFCQYGDSAADVDYTGSRGHGQNYDPETDDGYGRDEVYYDLAVNPNIDANQVASTLFDPQTDTAKRAAVAFVKAHGLDRAEAYEATTHWGYYGEEAEVSMRPEKAKEARDWFYSFANTDGHNNLLEKARDAGIDTRNMDEKEAVIATVRMLEPERAAALKTKLDQVDRVSVVSLTSRQLKLNAADMARYNAPEAAPAHGSPIGVVLHNPVEGTYEVLDGFEGIKRMMRSPQAKRKYTVLEMNDPRPRDRWGRLSRY